MILSIENFSPWLASGERGISSEAIVSHLSGIPIGGSWVGRGDHPRDPADFRRCELLLRAVPGARVAFTAMRDRSYEWATLVDHWDEIVALIDEEAPDAFTRGRGGAPKAYARMQELFAAERGQTSMDIKPGGIE